MNNEKTNTTQWHLCLSILVPIVLSACGGGSGGGLGSGSGGDEGEGDDTAAPTVSATTPADSATSVARNSSITATFNEDIFAVTVDESSFTLVNQSAESIPGSVSFDGVSNIASFTPDNSLALQAPYVATLSTAITDLAGNALAANYSWSFTTADGAWGSAELIETVDTGSANSPQIAVDNNGNAIAMWTQQVSGLSHVWSNRFDGTNWGTAEMRDSGTFANAPQIAFDNNGNALAVWSEFGVGSVTSIMANRFDGTSWGTAELIETDNTGAAISAQVAIDSEGKALAVWYQHDGSRFNIMANRFDGTSWGTAELLETDNAGSAISPKVAFDSNGNAIAVWGQNDGGLNNIMANRFDGTSWGTAELIETDAAGNAFEPQIVFDSNDNAIAVWMHSDGSRFNIMANRFDDTWGIAELIEAEDLGNADVPKVAADSNGNVVAVWMQHDGSRFNIMANRFNGSSWETAELIENDDAGDAYDPQIAFDNNGNALAVWVQTGASRANITTIRFNGSSLGTAELIENDDVGDAYKPQIAIDNNGNAIAVWAQGDGSRDNIMVNRFK